MDCHAFALFHAGRKRDVSFVPSAHPMTAEELFRANLPLVDRAIARVARRAGLTGAEAEDFASEAKIALMENDYAVLRRFEGRSSLATFITVVVTNVLHDLRTEAYGRWRPSAEAQRL